MQPYSLIGSQILDEGTTTQAPLHIRHGRFVDLPQQPIDLDGMLLRPGWINCHDHLELNHYPRTRPRPIYANAHDWGDDVNALLDSEPFSSLRRLPIAERCFIGGMKNLLSGATSVVHHGPAHKALFRQGFPVRVLQDYAWAHSLHFEKPEQIQRSYQQTPSHIAWFIHLAEGHDARAQSEWQHLRQLGCIGPNTVLIHGVGLTPEDIAEAAPIVRGLIWCPSTNQHLLGQTAPIQNWLAQGGRLALGSDSMLTADGDWLAERNAAQQLAADIPWDTLERDSRAISGFSDIGHFEQGAEADILGFEGEIPASPQRSDIQLIIRQGLPLIGSPARMAQFPWVACVDAELDGQPRRIHAGLARQLQRGKLNVTGLQLDAMPNRPFFFWCR